MARTGGKLKKHGGITQVTRGRGTGVGRRPNMYNPYNRRNTRIQLTNGEWYRTPVSMDVLRKSDPHGYSVMGDVGDCVACVAGDCGGCSACPMTLDCVIVTA